MDGLNGANIFTPEELETLFSDEGAQETPPADDGTKAQDGNQEGGDSGNTDAGNTPNDVTTTKAFANRLKESTAKAVQTERENIAKALGYDSYDALIKSREKQTLEDKGLDPDVVAPVIDDLVKQRIDNDPRMKELETYRNKQLIEFGKKELAELTELTGGKITSLAQLSPEVKKLWGEKGSLTKAYMELEGTNLVRSMRSEQSKGTTGHMNTPNGNATVPTGERLLTEEEKQAWRFFNPGISEEELNKKTVKK